MVPPGPTWLLGTELKTVLLEGISRSFLDSCDDAMLGCPSLNSSWVRVT